MERQLGLNLETAEERTDALKQYLAPLKLPDRQTKVLCLMSAHGERIEISGQRGSKLAISKRKAAVLMGCAPNTFVEGIADLTHLGVLSKLAISRPATYVVSWNRVARLEPARGDPLASIPLFDPDQTAVWSGMVSAGQAARDSVSRDLSKIRVRDSVYRDSMGAPTNVDPSRPWDRERGVTDDQLIAAVTSGDLAPLRRLYDEAVRLGWIGDCEDSRLRFLTIAHHAATSAGLTISRMGAVVSRVRRKLDVVRIRHDSEEWAAGVIRQRHHDRQLCTEVET
jgi:hypothetical protein